MLFLLIAGLLLASPVTAEAKTSNKKLNVNQTYKQYDITGDKKADILLISAERNLSSDYYINYSIYINGKKLFSKQGDIFFSFDIRRLE